MMTVGRSEGVDCDESQGRGAVDDDVVVAVPYGHQRLAHHALPVGHLQHFYLGTHEVDVGRNHMQSGEFRLYQGVLYVDLAYHNLVQRALLVIVRREVQTRSRVGLRIGVDYQDFAFQHGKRGSEVYRSRGFADTAFLVGYRYDFSHIMLFYKKTKLRKYFYFCTTKHSYDRYQ